MVALPATTCPLTGSAFTAGAAEAVWTKPANPPIKKESVTAFLIPKEEIEINPKEEFEDEILGGLIKNFYIVG